MKYHPHVFLKACIVSFYGIVSNCFTCYIFDSPSLHNLDDNDDEKIIIAFFEEWNKLLFYAPPFYAHSHV